MNDPIPPKQFYFKDKWFEDYREFWEYVKLWPSLPVDEETFKREWDQAGHQIWMNLHIQNVKCSNGHINEMMGKFFMLFLEEIIFKNDINQCQH